MLESSTEICSQELKEMLARKNQFGETYFQLAASWENKNFLDSVWQFAEKKLTRDELKLLLAEMSLLSPY